MCYFARSTAVSSFSRPECCKCIRYLSSNVTPIDLIQTCQTQGNYKVCDLQNLDTHTCHLLSLTSTPTSAFLPSTHVNLD